MGQILVKPIVKRLLKKNYARHAKQKVLSMQFRDALSMVSHGSKIQFRFHLKGKHTLSKYKSHIRNFLDLIAFFTNDSFKDNTKTGVLFAPKKLQKRADNLKVVHSKLHKSY